MAVFRKIHTSFWSDAFVQDLTPEQKYFFLYLLTNEKTSQCGIYEISKRQISYDTGYNMDTVSKLLEYFIKVRKVRYSTETNEIAIKNWSKYNNSQSPKVQVFVKQQLNGIKDKDLIQYIYSTDTDSLIRIRIEEEKEIEEPKNIEEFSEVFLQKKEDMVVIEMMNIWMKHKPRYPKDTEKDYHSLLALAYKIAEVKGWKRADVVGVKEKDVLVSWEKIVQFIVSDNWYSSKPISVICNQWQGVYQQMEEKLSGKDTKKECPVKIILK